MVIFLNGASSSGKSSIAQVLQLLLPVPCLNAGVDHFFSMLPAGLLDAAQTGPAGTAARLSWLGAGEGRAGTALAQADKWRADMRRTIACMAGLGNHLIVDEIITCADWVTDYQALLAGHDMVWVGVHCTLEIVEERERERARQGEAGHAGQAREHFDQVHAHCRYDIEVDSARLSPYQCARLIVDRAAQRYRWENTEQAPEMRTRTQGCL